MLVCKCLCFLAPGLSGGCGGKSWLWEKFFVGCHNRRAYQVLIHKISTALQRQQAVTSFLVKVEVLIFLGHSSPPLYRVDK